MRERGWVCRSLVGSRMWVPISMCAPVMAARVECPRIGARVADWRLSPNLVTKCSELEAETKKSGVSELVRN